MNIIPSYPRLDQTIKDAMLLTSGITFTHLLSKKLPLSLFEEWTPSGYPLWVATGTVGAALGREFFMLIQKGFSSESERTTNFLYCTGKDQTFPAKFLHSLLQIGGIALAFFFMTSPRCKQYLSKYGSLSLLPIGTSVVIGSAIVLLRKLGIGDYDYDKKKSSEEKKPTNPPPKEKMICLLLFYICRIHYSKFLLEFLPELVPLPPIVSERCNLSDHKTSF